MLAVPGRFSHLGGYGAAYYTYRWSTVIADDMFTVPDERASATARPRTATASWCSRPGGTKPAAELVADFLGRPISIDAYRAKMDKDHG